jgi:hypothetical protein
MSKSKRNSGKPWEPQNVKALEELAQQNTPTRVIGLKLGRTEDAVGTRPRKKTFPCGPGISHLIIVPIVPKSKSAVAEPSRHQLFEGTAARNCQKSMIELPDLPNV